MLFYHCTNSATE